MSILQTYSKTIFAIFASLLYVSIAACGGSSSGNNSAAPLPLVTSSAPADGATAVSSNIKVVAVFNSDMKSSTITQNSFSLQGAGETAIIGAVAYNADSRTATFSPTDTLTPDVVYTATITTAVKDASGVRLEDAFEWTFTTGLNEDSAAPSVLSSTPTNLDVDVLRNVKVGVYFSEPMDPATLTTTSFELKRESDDAVVSGDLLYINPTTIVFNPTDLLDSATDYVLTLTAGITDLADNSLTPLTIRFRTGTDVSSSPDPVDLLTAGNYVVLAKTGISTTGTTHITGDIAVSPEFLTAITGFSQTLDASGTFATSPLVTGKLFAADLTAPTPDNLTTAISDMETAYTNAAARLDPDFTELGAGEIGGLTLDPGLYKWGTGVLVSSDVTLTGDANDVWIFQIGQDLKLQDGRAVVLIGGALPENVFWQVAGEVTLQAGAAFNGIILSQTGIVLKSGATINGRALAQTAVTLISNSVAQPAQ
ncbi:MAG: ice-binding family protein [Alcanivoracaceae bacterium]|nr:ice-binding family protein [Alcanivoracaceae bacterium]